MAASGKALQGQDNLPGREKGLYRDAIKLWEQKNYKKALKNMDSVLSKFPDHGEAQAIKAMILNSSGKREEATVLAKTAIRAHMASPTTWHVLGMIHRSAEEYVAAMKSYRQALRLKPDNNNIMRDMALLQIQTRDVAGFRDTQHAMMTGKGGSETNWAGFALGLHLTGYTQLALHVLEKYEGVLAKSGRAGRNYASTELVLLKTRLREEAGDLPGALAEMEAGWPTLLDKHTGSEVRARLLSLSGDWAGAGALWRDLLAHVNPDNYLYHRGVIASILQPADAAAALDMAGTATLVSSAAGAAAVTPAQLEELLAFYDGAAAAAGRAKAHKRVPLDFLPAGHAGFRPRLAAYLRAAVAKGVPSLPQDIKRLYEHPGKAEAIGEELAAIHAEAVAAAAGAREGGPGGAPTDVLWALANLGAHARRQGDFEAGLAHAEAALAHSPTVIELYSLKARCLKALGRLGDAADTLVEARLLDLADRHINTKCVKYLLAAGRLPEAASTMALFARQEGDPLFNIIDMQHVWYCLRAAQAYAAAGDTAMALKRFHNVHTHFNTWIADQFDFHQYVLRRVNLRVYLDFIAWVDGLHGAAPYLAALQGLAAQYLHLARHPELRVNEDGVVEPSEEELAAMTPAERKKAKNKLKAARRKAAAAKEAAGGAAGGGGGKKSKKAPKVDPDPKGFKYLATEDPLAAAAQFAALLLACKPGDASAGLLAAEIALEGGKGAAAAQGLAVAMRAGDAADAAAVEDVKAKLAAWAAGAGASAHAAVRTVVAEVLSGTLPTPGDAAVSAGAQA